jgi:integrase
MQLSEITPQDVNHRIDRLRKTASEQNHAVAAIKIFFRWAERRRYVDHSPCEGLEVIKRPSRCRVLSDPELAAVYRIAGGMGHPFGSIVQLCILTGQRRSEIGWLPRSYVKGDTVNFPASLTKNNRDHIFPICVAASAIINNAEGDADLLFEGARGENVFSNGQSKKPPSTRPSPLMATPSSPGPSTTSAGPSLPD